jgi:hypothetical protein
MVPGSHFIECTCADNGDLTIALIAGAHSNAARERAAALSPVQVPQRLSRSRAVAAALRDDAGKKGFGSLPNRHKPWILS